MDEQIAGRLSELAESYNLKTSFYDGLGRLRTPPPEAVLAVLKSLGAAVEELRDLPEALRIRREQSSTRLLEPVLVRWGTSPLHVPVKKRPSDPARFKISLVAETGESHDRDVQWTDLPLWIPADASPEGTEHRLLALDHGLAAGYHCVRAETPSGVQDSLLICSPLEAFRRKSLARSWGVFAPLYAIHSRRSWGIGDFTDLRELALWTAGIGGSFVGTLPLFASFLDLPCDPSPYTPVSRLFWNELFLDPTAAPEWQHCWEARKLFNSGDFQLELGSLKVARLLDYRRLMRLKRSALELLAEFFFSRTGAAGSDFAGFLGERPEVRDYARFRAVQETLGTGWEEWPARLRAGDIRDGDFPVRPYNYHLYVQWLSSLQIKRALDTSSQVGAGLYMDLPLGTHSDGFDVWSHPAEFARGVSGGAPPDAFFTAGQEWGFRPLHPEASRQVGHRYFRKILRWLFRQSELIRIDHAMSLQRLYWVPQGFSAAEGVYVSYPMEELLAIVVLESHREQCEIVGEDLGTVTPEIRFAMDRSHLNRMYVGQFECSGSEWPPVREIPEAVVASINTHDTPTFTSFWNGNDIDDRLSMNLITPDMHEAEHRSRAELREVFQRFFQIGGSPLSNETASGILESWLSLMAESRARFFLVNLEDLWMESLPQNVPGTSFERPNWRRKLALSLEELSRDPRVLGILDRVRELRSRPESP